MTQCNTVQWNLFKAEPFKADTSSRGTVVPVTDGFTVKHLQKTLHKMDTYRACSHKTATFFVYQIKILPKKLSVKRTQDRIKNNFHARNTHIFSLKLLLGKILRSSFQNNFFTPFSAQSIAFSGPKKLHGLEFLVHILLLD